MTNQDTESDWQTRGLAWSLDARKWRGRLVPPARQTGLATRLSGRGAFPPRTLDTIRSRGQQLFSRDARAALPVAHAPREDARATPPESGGALDPEVQRQLEYFLRTRLPPVRIHSGGDADRITRRAGAAAVSTADSIYFRKGAYQPQSRAGMALLAHEMTHVAWREGARPVVPAGSRSAPAEEEVALGNERRFLAQRPAMPLLPPAATPSAPRVTPPAAAPTAPPPFVHAAMADRDLQRTDADPAPQLPMLTPAAIRALREELFDSLLDRLRSDFERGA